MSGFREVLLEVSRGLAVRHDARERVLRELAADLDGFYREAREVGLDEASARARAVEFADLGAGAQAAMVEVHGPVHRRWSSTLPKSMRTGLERGALLVCLLLVLKIGLGLTHAAREFEAVTPASFWLAPAGLMAAGIFFTGLGAGWSHHINGDHRPDRYEDSALATRAWTLIVALLGIAGLGHTLVAAWLEARHSVGIDGAALLRDQLVHLRSQLALVSAYLGMGTLALVVHARVLARAAFLRGLEDELIDELTAQHTTHSTHTEPEEDPCT